VIAGLLLALLISPAGQVAKEREVAWLRYASLRAPDVRPVLAAMLDVQVVPQGSITGGGFSIPALILNSPSQSIGVDANNYLQDGNPAGITVVTGGSAKFGVYPGSSAISILNGICLIWAAGVTNPAGGDTSICRLAGGVITIGNNAGGLAWYQWAGLSRLSADYTNATASFSSTALSITVTNTRIYPFQADLYLTESTAADGVAIDFAGGTATMTNFVAHCELSNAVGTVLTATNAATAALGTVINIGATTDANQHHYSCAGTIEASSTGTFIIRARQNTHSTGTLTIKRGSALQAFDAP
jgi:hypothetical protein